MLHSRRQHSSRVRRLRCSSCTRRCSQGCLRGAPIRLIVRTPKLLQRSLILWRAQVQVSRVLRLCCMMH